MSGISSIISQSILTLCLRSRTIGCSSDKRRECEARRAGKSIDSEGEKRVAGKDGELLSGELTLLYCSGPISEQQRR